MGRTKSERATLGEERGVEKESQMFFTNQDRSTRMLGHSIVYVHFVRACVWKRTRMIAQRVCVYSFKNCAPPLLLSGRGKQTPISTIEREGEIMGEADRKTESELYDRAYEV